MKTWATIVLFCIAISISAQKKVMQHKDKALWNSIRNVNISNSGDYILYGLNKGEKDETLYLKSTKGNQIMSHTRTKGGKFTFDSKFAIFSVNDWKDSITELKRKKVKKKDFPKDTLVIFNIGNQQIEKIPNVKSYKIPEKWSGIVAYYLAEATPKKGKAKKSKNKTKKNKAKKVSNKNGYHLIIRQLESGIQDTLQFVTKHTISKEGKVITYSTTGIKGKIKSGVYKYDVNCLVYPLNKL